MVCAERGDMNNLVQILSRQNLDINLQDSEGKTSLHKAVYYEHVDCVKEMLHRPNPAHRFMQDSSGCTPLHVAVAENNFYLAELLLSYPEIRAVYGKDHGGGIDFQDNKGDTALLKAMDMARFDIAELLADRHGADVGIKNGNGRNAMDIAHAWGTKDTIAMLEEAGAEPSTDTLDGYTLITKMEGVELTTKQETPRNPTGFGGTLDVRGDRGRKRYPGVTLGLDETDGRRSKSARRYQVVGTGGFVNLILLHFLAYSVVEFTVAAYLTHT